jgi:hypothetical protein
MDDNKNITTEQEKPEEEQIKDLPEEKPVLPMNTYFNPNNDDFIDFFENDYQRFDV